MRANYKVELASGIFLLLGVLALLWLATRATDYGREIGAEAYRITARFTNIAELKDRAPVKIGGVVVGQVDKIELDPTTFEAVVTMRIDQRYDEIPLDTSASVLTSGVLGDRYIGLEPGGAMDFLSEGDQLFVTQSAVVLEQLLSKYLFSTQSDKEGETSP